MMHFNRSLPAHLAGQLGEFPPDYIDSGVMAANVTFACFPAKLMGFSPFTDVGGMTSGAVSMSGHPGKEMAFRAEPLFHVAFHGNMVARQQDSLTAEYSSSYAVNWVYKMNRFESEGLLAFLLVLAVLLGCLGIGVIFLVSHIGFIGIGL